MTIEQQGAIPNAASLQAALNAAALPSNALLLGAVPPLQRRLVIIGDSRTADINAAPTHANHAGITDSLVPLNGTPNGALTNSGPVLVIGAERMCPPGTGTLSYNKATNGITWQANGDTGPGAAVLLDRTKTVKLNSATSGYGLWVTLRPDGANATTYNNLPEGITTDATVNVGATGNGYSPVMQVTSTTFADWLRGDLHPTYTVVGKFAESGNYTVNCLGQLPEILALRPDEALIGPLGTNDIGAGVAFSTYATNIVSLISGLVANGVKCTVISEIPRGDLNSAQKLRGLSRYLEQFCANTQNQRQMVRFIDLYSQLMTTTPAYTNATTYDINTALYGTDHLHPNVPGSATTLSSAISAIMKDPNAPAHYEAETDLYDSTNNYYGNLISNPQMLSSSSRPAGVPTGSGASTAGVNSGGTPTGTPPDDWTLSGTGLTYAHTSPTRVSVDATDTTRGNWWNINVTAGFGTQGFAYISIPLANFVAGDVIEHGFDFSVDNASVLTDLHGMLFFNGADKISCGQYNGDNFSTKGGVASAMRKFWKSARWKVPASWAWAGQAGNPSLVQYRIYFRCSAAINLRLGNVFVRKVAP